MTLSVELVYEWSDAFDIPITVTVSDRVDYIYEASLNRNNTRSTDDLGADDRGLVYADVEKHLHPLKDHRPHLYNLVRGQFAPAKVNVADSIVLGEMMKSKYIASLPDGFLNIIRIPIKTMNILTRQDKGKPVINLDKLFLQLLRIGRRRQMELSYGLCAVPPSLISAKSHQVGAAQAPACYPCISPTVADVVIVDVLQLFFHFVLSYGGSSSDRIHPGSSKWY